MDALFGVISISFDKEPGFFPRLSLGKLFETITDSNFSSAILSILFGR
jgi:hypothetical protein